MSQENVELVREMVAAFNRDDLPGALRVMDPEIRFECQTAPVQGIYRGHDGVSDFAVDMGELFETVQLDCPDVRDLGARVLALGIARTVGRGSGIEFETPLAIVARFRNGRMTDYKDFGNRQDALEAAGLSE
jgi:ketosteroid isomerase-like protein